MTALSGCVGHNLQHGAEVACREALSAQRIYGSRNSAVRSLEGASFGISLFEALPEDRADDQPCLLDRRMLVADIRIDNREEIVAALAANPFELKEKADSQLLALAWRRWGPACLERIVGDYALAVFDADARSLTLARDFSGERPLFYADRGDAIAFASMPSGLLIDPANRRGLDLDRLAAMLAGFPARDDSSYYHGIRKVMPGEIVTFANGQRHRKEIWTPSFGDARAPRKDYVDEYRDVLDTAVKCRMRRTSGPLGAFLSAGYDSGAVAATAARLGQTGEPLVAYTSAPRVGFDGPVPAGRVADESDLAAMVAAQHGLEHVVVRSSARALDTVEAQAATYQEPFRNVLNLDWVSAIRRAAHQRGVRVMLNGELGNLSLNAGGSNVLGDLIARGEWRSWSHEAAAILRRPDVRLRSLLYNSFEPWLPPAFDRWLTRRYLGLDLRQDNFLKKPWLDRVTQIEDQASPRPRQDSYRRRFEIMKSFDPGMMRKGALAETGVETRDPLADRRVIQFSLTLPSDQLFRDGVPWPLARAALSDRLPPEILRTRIRGIQSADWHERLSPDDVRRMIEDISASATVRELIDFARLRDAVDRWPKTALDSGSVIGLYAGVLPMTLAAGYFLLYLERSLGLTLDRR